MANTYLRQGESEADRAEDSVKFIGTNHWLPMRKAGCLFGWKFLKTYLCQKNLIVAVAVIGAYGLRRILPEGLFGHDEWRSVRVGRYGPKNMPYGSAAA